MSFLDIIYTLLIGPLQLIFEIIFTIANRITGHPGIAIIALSLIMNFLVLPLYRSADAMQEEAINFLPILMAIVNIVSSALYLKGFPLKTKIQLYAMAMFFLVFLYTSPSGLVFYWTLNNLFSLAKNIFYKLKNPKRVLEILSFFVGISVWTDTVASYGDLTLKGKAVLIVAGIAFQIPLILYILGNVKRNKILISKEQKYNKTVFLWGSIFLTIYIGILIPSAVIAASPIEFVDVSYYHNSVWYLVYSGCLAAGIFLVWMRVFYWLATDKGKAIFDRFVWILCGTSIINYMFFGTNMGILSPNLQYEQGVNWGLQDEMSNFLILQFAVAVLYFVFQKINGNIIGNILLTMVIATSVMLGTNVIKINDANAELEQQIGEEVNFNLSKTGKNVIVFMLDRAMSQYVPCIFNEKPELKEQFAGFTYYSNTISYGGYTNFTTPSLFGGYEYIPIEINKRDEEPLVAKQNKALKVMPAIFDGYDYEVTVCDPPYAGYAWIPDLSIYDELPKVKTYITQGKYSDVSTVKRKIEINKRNFFCHSIMKVMPLLLQETIYDEGLYNQADAGTNSIYTTQVVKGTTISEGLSSSFIDQYNVLLELSGMTRTTEENMNTFLMISNCTTHEPMLLQEPEYEPSLYVDNTEYDLQNQNRFEINGRKMKVENALQMSHYQTNMAAFIQLGKWFDYMRENDVYDNTRIILVADHGRALGQFDEVMLDGGSSNRFDLESYYPLLMIKDFNSSEYMVSNEFMTNADVPILAMDGLIENPVNPYTGKKIENTAKTSDIHFIFAGNRCVTSDNNGNVFLPEPWLIFRGENVWDKNNWEIIKKETSMPID
ncbi:MAG: hypothetical protein IKY94_09725 [Lachnospiraceae bacterium]|nr:hypothetical protein [Lachnospiraceae bacterium]